MDSGAGIGRGGRGAQLLQALQQASRKPGADIGNGDARSGASIAQTTMGRGQYLASLLQSSAKISEESRSTQPSCMGRGILVTSATTKPTPLAAVPSSSSKPMGRGIALQNLLSGGKVASPSPPPAIDTQPGSRGSEPVSEPRTDRHDRQAKAAIVRHGMKGDRIPLVANSIRVNCEIEALYMYLVSYNPEIDSRNMRIRLLYEHSDVIGQVRMFNGMHLNLPKKLPQDEMCFTSTRPTDNAVITVSVKLVRCLPPEEWVGHLNLILRKVMSILQMKQVGRHYYDPVNPVMIPAHKLEVWPGYVTAINRHEGGLLLLLDVSHKVIRTDTVLDVLEQLKDRNRGSVRDEALKMLVGATVLTRYNNKTYRIDDISFDQNPQHTFTNSKGQEMTFIEYFQKQHNKVIQPNQPLLLNRPKKREQGASTAEVLCLIPELCYMTGLTDELRQDFRVMKNIAVHTRVTPTDRQASMRRFVKNVTSNTEAKTLLSNWGIRLDNDTLQLEGRCFPPEMIKFKDTSVSAGKNADWGNALTLKVKLPVNISNWLLVYTTRDKCRTLDYVRMTQSEAPKMGIHVRDPIHIELPDDKTTTYLAALRENLNGNVQVVVTIFPTSRDDRYNAVKRLCYVEQPVASQAINSRTLDPKKLRSVTQKIVLQINAKLGGELWSLSVPLKGLMVVGIDSYHDAGRAGQSVGGFVASINPDITRWYSRVAFQTSKQELIDQLKPCMLGALKKYHDMNHALPDRVIVFRDGVGDGQLDMVSNYEVQQIESCWSHFGESYAPKLDVVVVQKRINTRLFSIEGRNMFGNPTPGTIMDHTVVREQWYDFFLISQHVRQGTVTPTHYVVVHDGGELAVDHMQRLSYKMTHMYYNWPGTVRVPAPCQYAHKLAQMAGQNLKKEPHSALSDKLFFL